MSIRTRALAALAIVGAGLAAILPATPAAAAGTDCVVTGYTAPNASAADKLRSDLRNGSVADGGGVQLNNQKAWQVPAGSTVVIVVTAADETAKPTITGYAGGVALNSTSAGANAAGRVVSAAFSVDPGAITATTGVRIGGDCTAQDLVLRAKRAPLTTIVGAVGLALTLIFGFLVIFLARRRPGGWLRRAAIALVPGLLAGVGEVAVLFDAGAFGPFAPTPWAFAGIGVLLALLLPLTRRRRKAASAGAPVREALPNLGRYVPESLFTRTAAGTVYRAFDPATQQRVLVKLAHPEQLPPAPAPAFAAPGFPGAPQSAPPYGAPVAPTQQFGAPVSGVPAYGPPGSPTQQFGPTQQFVPTQQFGPPVSGIPSSGPPASGIPASAPPYGPPVSGAPGYGPPVSGAPAFGPPVSGVPGYGPPVSGPPGYPAPGSPAPGYPAPGYPAPGAGQPGYAPPVAPGFGTPAPGQVPAPELGNVAGPLIPVQPAPGQPGFIQAGPGQPGTDPATQPVAGTAPATDQTAQLDPTGAVVAPPEPERAPSQPVEYLVPDRFTPGQTGQFPAGAAPTGEPTGTQLTVIQQRFLRDVDVMRRLNNPFCLRARDAFGPVVVTDYIDGMPLRQLLVEKGRLTGAQSMVVTAGTLRGLSAVHELGLVHRDVTPYNIYLDQSGRSVLADFELAAPVGEAVPAAGDSTYLSPEQRSGLALDARSDLFTIGLVLAELLTGEVPVVAPEVPRPASWAGMPQPLTDLLNWALSLDPAARPANATVLLAELERVASTVFGADWLTIGAVTGGILVPAGVVAAASAGAAGVVGGGAASGVAATSAETGLHAVVGVGGQVGAQGGRTLLSVGSAVAGAVLAVTVAITGATAAPKPKPVAEDILTIPAATVILNRTFGEAQHSNNKHVADTAAPTLSDLFNVNGTDTGRLTNIKVKFPNGQREQHGYPAQFDAIATEVLRNGDTAYLYFHFERPAIGQPWKLVGTYYSLNKADAPTLDPKPPLVDPAKLPGLYLDFFKQAVTSHSTTNSVLEVDENSLFTFSAQVSNQVRNSSYFEIMTPQTVTVTRPAVYLANGTAKMAFVVRVKVDLYNRTGPYSGDCSTYRTYFDSGHGSVPSGYFKEVHAVWAITVSAVIPSKDSGSKVQLTEGADWVFENPTGIPC